MRNVVFAINMTVDGSYGHESLVADDELHEYFTGLLRDSDIEIFGRNTYHLMYPYWNQKRPTNLPARSIRYRRSSFQQH
jgi:hypothetical protein